MTTSLKKSLKSLNFRQVLEILEKSLNFNSNFGRSLKSPWILKMILETLEFRAQYDLPHTFFQIGAATQHTSILHSTSLQFFSDMWLYSFVIFFFGGTLYYLTIESWCFCRILTSLKIMARSLKYPWIILEFCREDFVVTLMYLLKTSQAEWETVVLFSQIIDIPILPGTFAAMVLCLHLMVKSRSWFYRYHSWEAPGNATVWNDS